MNTWITNAISHVHEWNAAEDNVMATITDEKSTAIYLGTCEEDVHVYYCASCAKKHVNVKKLHYWQIEELKNCFRHLQCHGRRCTKELLYPGYDMSLIQHDTCPTWYECQNH